MALLLAAALVLPAGDAPDFATEVLPVLSDHCFHCHGPDAATRKAGLRLDTREGALSVIEPGDLELWVGGSSADRETTATAVLEGPVHPVGRSDGRWTLTD